MANKGEADANVTTTNLPQKTDTTTKVPTSAALAGAERFFDGNTHVGVAVMVSSDGNPSTLMIPDIAGVKDGEPVFITKPIRLKGKNLKTLLGKFKLDKKVMDLIEDTSISCEAFYYTIEGPLLMMFALKFDKGLINTLTGVKELSDLFEVKGASLRVLRCAPSSADVLKQYAALLEG
jgi:hypothetical protein